MGFGLQLRPLGRRSRRIVDARRDGAEVIQGPVDVEWLGHLGNPQGNYLGRAHFAPANRSPATSWELFGVPAAIGYGVVSPLEAEPMPNPQPQTFMLTREAALKANAQVSSMSDYL